MSCKITCYASRLVKKEEKREKTKKCFFVAQLEDERERERRERERERE